MLMSLVFSSKGKRRRLEDKTEMKCTNSENVPTEDREVEQDINFDCNSVEETTLTEESLASSEIRVASVGDEDDPDYLSSVDMNDLPENEIKSLLTLIETTAASDVTASCSDGTLNFSIGKLKTVDNNTDLTLNVALSSPNGTAICKVTKGTTDIIFSLNSEENEVKLGQKISYESQNISATEVEGSEYSIPANSFTSNTECPLDREGKNLPNITNIEMIRMTKPEISNGKLRVYLRTLITGEFK